ncbi:MULTISPECIES: class I SAM-dependent methyltransferase [Chryseobacterium]|uniref:class I SAM-dependent methyltransferase n=1 Tax=Chryseobacterium sp. R2A-55 TaxID=2744445 RepID=UPI001F3DE295|nr:class I SAM-dependent methyltransferase [Chryseobacterium sp. R2A-55]
MTDLPGKAIHDFHFLKSKHKLFVRDTFGPKVEMPISYYFRKLESMPELERRALELCRGKVLDIGAAAGSHALELQKNGLDVTALEISPSACEVMKDRGLQKIVCEDFFKFKVEKYDTLLLMMNGIGLSSTLDGFVEFLEKAEELLTENGQIIFDSCDVSYMYEHLQKPDQYFGQVQCRYEYQDVFTDWFHWLYLDRKTMRNLSNKAGWNVKIDLEDRSDQYLAVLTKKF